MTNPCVEVETANLMSVVDSNRFTTKGLSEVLVSRVIGFYFSGGEKRSFWWRVMASVVKLGVLGKKSQPALFNVSARGLVPIDHSHEPFLFAVEMKSLFGFRSRHEGGTMRPSSSTHRAETLR